MNWQLPAVSEEDVAGWESRIRGVVTEFGNFAGAVQRLGATTQQQAEQQRQAEQATVRRDVEAGRTKLDRALREAVESARATAGRKAAELAPGLAGLPFDHAAWRSPEALGAGAPGQVRIGTADIPGRTELAVVAPLLATLGWYVTAAPEVAAQLTNNVLLRLVATVPAGTLRVDSYDPTLTGALGAFGAMRDQAPDIVNPAATSPEQLQARLAELAETVNRRAQKMTQLGCRTFSELLTAAPRLVEPYRVLVVHAYPAGLDDRLHGELLRIVGSAQSRGVCFLVHHNADQQPASDVDPTELGSQLRRISSVNGQLQVDGLAGIRCKADSIAPAELFTEIGTKVALAVQSAALPTVTLDEVMPALRERWQPARDELRAVIGLDDNNSPAGIRLRSKNPATPNVLVGGSVGTGKSNLLLVLIHGLAARYSPDDLEMYLLDFKQGLEFADLGPGPDREHWLPHAKVLGVYSDREFGLAVLRHVAAQMPVRSEVFKRHNVSDIADLVPGPDRPARILLVLDEFQILLAEEDETSEEATAMLEKLVRLGRAFGIHVVLATQTLDGIARLAAKRDAIFGQVHYRIALRTTPSDSQLLLETHNTAATSLRFRGQAILNDNLGALDANRGVLVAYAKKDDLDLLRRELWRRRADPTRPRIFQQEAPAALAAALLGADPAAVPPEEDGTVLAWVGQPVSVIELPVCLPVRPEPGGGLLILGEDADMALGVCNGLMASLARAGHRRGDRFIVLDLLAADQRLQAGLRAGTELAHRLGCHVERVGAKDVAQRLCDLRAELDERSGDEPAVHVLGLGLHRATRLNTPLGDSVVSPADALRELAEQGGGVGVFLYGWWSRISSCTNHLGYDRAQIGAYLFLRHAIDGIREVCGQAVQWVPGPNRGLFWDGIAPDPIPLVTFAALTDEDVADLVKEL